MSVDGHGSYKTLKIEEKHDSYPLFRRLSYETDRGWHHPQTSLHHESTAVDFVSCWPEVWGDRAAVVYSFLRFVESNQLGLCLLEDWNGTKRFPWHWDPLLPEVWVEHVLKWLPLSSKIGLLGSMLIGWSADQLPSWDKVSSGPCEPRPWSWWLGRTVALSMHVGVSPWSWRRVASFLKAVPVGDIGGYDGQVKGNVKKCLVGRLGYQTLLSGLSWLTC